jgi:hypothetical protein
MSRLATLSVSLALLLVAFPLISVGTTRGPAGLWWAGLVLLAAGGLIPPLWRLLFKPEAPKEPPKAGMQDDERA